MVEVVVGSGRYCIWAFTRTFNPLWPGWSGHSDREGAKARDEAPEIVFGASIESLSDEATAREL